MKRYLILVLAGFILTAAVGSGSFYAYQFLKGLGGEYENVRVAESQPAISKIPHYLALKKSFYRDQNVKVNTIDCPGDREALAALESGRADVALIRPSSLILKRTSDLKEGTGPVAFASLDRGTSYHLVARENKPLDDIKSLKNKSVIAGPPDSMETVFFESTLRDAGFSPYDSVTIITNIPEEIKMGALKAGTGHYLLLEDRDLPAAAARGFFRVMTFKAEFPTFVCVASREFWSNRPEALQRFTNALYMAQTWMKYRTAADTAAVIKNIPGIDRDSLPGLVARYYENGSLSESPVLPGKNIDTVVKLLDRSREIPMPVSSRELVTGQFAESAVKTVRYIPEKEDRTGLQRLKFWD
ncbi:MAG: ABC transporter substrate-binding protein [Desulfocucumaceae bacterium]